MNGAILDAETILSFNDQWQKLEEEWGIPVDLDIEEDITPSKLKPVLSSLDLLKSTFDSSFLFKNATKKIARQMSKRSLLDYQEFLKDLQKHGRTELPSKQFYYLNGQIISARSVDDICIKIDDIFKSVEKLYSATSTMRQKKKVPEVVQCSISYADLSFDDTEEEKGDDDVDQFIDEAFEQLNSTRLSVIEEQHPMNVTITKDSVTTLVKKFTSFLKSPIAKNPRRKRECNERFRDLAEYWRSKTCDQ